MFDIHEAYIRYFTDLAQMRRGGETNEAILQSLETVLNVISNDVRFRSKNYIELSQGEEK